MSTTSTFASAASLNYTNVTNFTTASLFLSSIKVTQTQSFRPPDPFTEIIQGGRIISDTYSYF